MLKLIMILCLLLTLPTVGRGADADAVPAPAYTEEIAAKIVRRAYQKELARAPDRSGMETYRPLIQSGERDEAWLRGVLRMSEENKPRLQKLRREHWILGLRTLSIFSGVWTVVLAMFWAFGDGIARKLLGESVPSLNPFQKMILGFGGVVAVLQPASLLAPLSGTALLVFLTCGVIAIACSALRLRGSARTSSANSEPERNRDMPTSRVSVFFSLGVAFVVIAAAASAQRYVVAYDSLLYHLSTLRWINEFPAVPGLANLHIRLGTNSAWLLFSGLLDNGPLDRRTAWFMPGLMCLLFLFYLLHILCFSGAQERKVRILAALLLPFGLLQLVSLAPSLYFDLPAHNLLAVCLIELVRWLERPAREDGTRPALEPGHLLMIAIPATLSFIIKPIGAPFLALAAILTLASYIRCLQAGKRDWRTHTLHLSPAALLAGWMLRNAVLSGWLLFPAQALRLPVDWAVPADPVAGDHVSAIQTVKGQIEILQAFARKPGTDHTVAIHAPLGSWLPDWYRQRSGSIELRWLLPSGLLGLLAGVVPAIRRRTGWSGPGLGFLIGANLAFWFHNAPDLRYGSGLFWMWFAYGCTLALTALPNRPPWSARSTALAFSASAAISVMSLRNLPDVLRHTPWLIGQASPRKTSPLTLVNGQNPPFVVQTPDFGDQCGDAELPCTPYPRDILLMRKPGDLRSGFRVAENQTGDRAIE